MKDAMIEVLMYLFENHMEDDCSLHMTQDMLTSELQHVGFHLDDIYKAYDWIEDLIKLQANAGKLKHTTKTAFRVFTSFECVKLNIDCQGFILFLEQVGILNPTTRELVIDRVMELVAERVELYQVKWVVLMILFNQPGEEAALACMEHLVLEDTLGGVH